MRYRIAEFFATGIYSGYLPRMPGTWGTILAVPLAFYIGLLDFPWRVSIVALVTAIGFWSTYVMVKARGEDDPGYVVIDEIAGYLLAVVFIDRPGILALLIAFVFFRLFDIIKPPPVAQFDRMHGATGVMLDDLAAGVMAGLCLLGVLFGLNYYGVELPF